MTARRVACQFVAHAGPKADIGDMIGIEIDNGHQKLRDETYCPSAKTQCAQCRKQLAKYRTASFTVAKRARTKSVAVAKCTREACRTEEPAGGSDLADFHSRVRY
jgi:hypothetical protein